MNSLFKEFLPVIGCHRIHRRYHIVQRVRHNLDRAVLRSVEPFTEIVQRSLPPRLPPNNRVCLQPEQRALVIIVRPPPPSRSCRPRSVQNLHRNRRVLQVPPCAPGPLVQIRRRRRQVLPQLRRCPESAACCQHHSVILCQPLVHPQQIALHRFLIVCCRQSCRPPIFPVPRVKKFVRQQVHQHFEFVRIQQHLFRASIVARFVVFQSVRLQMIG